MTHTDAVMSVLLKHIVPDDEAELRAMIMSRSCPKKQYGKCTKSKMMACVKDINVRIRCWGESCE